MRTFFTVLSIAVTLFFAATAVFPAGRQEDPVDEAEQLIDERRYNDAIEILQEVGRSDPERFEEAERLLRRIRDARARYNDLWEELITTLQNEPDNVSRANEIINEMEELDDAPTERALEEFRQWRNIVRLRFNLNRFEEIATTALEHIVEQEYRAAIEEYASGLGLFREEFQEIGYEQDLVEDGLGAEDLLRSVAENAAGHFSAVQGEVDRIIERLPTGQVTDEDIESLRTAFEAVAESEFRAAGLGGLARTLNARARSAREMNDPDPYLTFLRWFAYGRTAQAGREGVFAAIRLFVERELTRLTAAGEPVVESLLEEIENEVDVEAYASAGEYLREVGSTLSVLERVLEVNDIRESVRAELAPGVDRATVPDRQPTRRGYELAHRASAEIAALAAMRANITELSDENEPVGTLEETWQSAAGQFREADELFSTVREISAQASTAAAEQPAAYLERMEPLAARFHQDIADRELEAVTIYLSELNARSENQIASFRADLDAADLIGFGGVPYEQPEAVPREPEAPDDEEGLTYRYPEIARSRLQQTETDIDSRLEQLGTARELLEQPNPPVGEDERVAELRERLDELWNTTRELLDETRIALEDLDERIARSEELREEVGELLSEAEALVEDDPDAADDRFSDAEDALIEALELQQDPAFRDEIDTRLADLGSRIRDAQYQRAVVEVRELVNEGRRLYRQDQFGDAESVLLQAQEQWDRVSTSENRELQYWLRLTQSALNLQDDRELTDTDPLFRALGNWLSLARDAFDRGQAALERGNEERAEELFARAEEKVQNVIVARPFNRDARVLSLRITELTNPEEFEQIFQQRLEQALEGAEENPTEAISDLYDLREVDPDWPGLDEAIEQVEIAAGIREPPADDTRTQQADELFAQATSQYQAGNLESAQDLLQEAIQLDPDNDDARELLDEVRLEIGTTTAPTLSSAELQQFRRAENHFIDGQIGRALLIVERLWEDEDNRDYSPLANLRARMVSR